MQQECIGKSIWEEIGREKKEESIVLFEAWALLSLT